MLKDSCIIVTIPPQSTIHNLKEEIYDKQVKFIVKCGSSKLALRKVRYITTSM